MWRLFLLLLLGGTSACAVRQHTVGLVQETGSILLTPAGDRYRLVLRDDAVAVRHLDGTQVAVDGPRVGRLLWVGEWQVTDAGDGSAPFVGVLRWHGARLVLDDRNSGMPVMLDAESAAALTSHVGKLVVLIGFVVGAQEVRVVGYRVLED